MWLFEGDEMKKAAEKTANIDMSGFQPRGKTLDGQAPGSAGAATEVPNRKYTGVGSVMAAITREAEVATELGAVRAELKATNEKLAEFDGATLVRALDPRVIVRSRWANRNEAEFATEEFRLLKEEISQAGGNVQPIKVRVFDGQTPGRKPKTQEVFDGQTPLYEIVFGHRRYQACAELGLPVNAVIVDQMDDRALFEAMDRENRARKNLSPWEQGRMYDEAVKHGLYPSIRRLAESLGVNLSDASRCIQLAKLPKEVIGAFTTPLDLQVRWSKPLADALQRDPDGVLGRAKDLGKKPHALDATTVFERLVGKAPKSAFPELDISVAGKKLATLKSGSKGRALVEFEAGALTEDRREALVMLLSEFLAR